jgi:hypothetical protein
MLSCLLPVAVALDGATVDIEAGIPATETVLGVIILIAMFVLGMCWRVTTPHSALPLEDAVAPIGDPGDPWRGYLAI